jgi:ankyrin repeat protein
MDEIEAPLVAALLPVLEDAGRIAALAGYAADMRSLPFVCASLYNDDGILAAQKAVTYGPASRTRLMALARAGDLRRVQLLVRVGAEVNPVNATPHLYARACTTVLHCACEGGSAAVVGFLLDEGAHLTARDAKGNLPVHTAASAGRAEVVALLLDKRAGGAAQAVAAPPVSRLSGQDMYRALQLACVGGHTATARALLDRGAALTVDPDTWAVKHLDSAAASGSVELLALLLDRLAASPAFRRDAGRSLAAALCSATHSNRGPAVVFLLSRGAPRDGTAVQTWEVPCIPLMQASRAGAVHALRALLHSGADPNTGISRHGRGRAVYTESALYSAARAGHTAAVALLADAGARVDDGKAHSALVSAARHGHEAVACLLIERGADILGIDAVERRTPLEWACWWGHVRLLTLLLDRGASSRGDPNVVGRALARAVQGLREASIRILFPHVPPPGIPAKTVARYVSETVAASLRTDGCHAQALRTLRALLGATKPPTDALGLSLLQAAVRGCSVYVAEALLEVTGADGAAAVLRAADASSGETALHIAASSLNVDLVRYQIAVGADVVTPDAEGDTPLHAAVSGSRKKSAGHDPNSWNSRSATWGARQADQVAAREDIVRLLLDAARMSAAGSTAVNVLNKQGSTPLLLATRLTASSSIHLLISHGGADPGAGGGAESRTAVLLASSRMGDLPLVRLLLGRGDMDVHSRGRSNETLLHAACSSISASPVRAELVRLLLAASASPHDTDDKGETPLHKLCNCWMPSAQRVEIVTLLLDAGADPGALDEMGRSPVHGLCAVDDEARWDVASLRLLLDRGVSVGMNENGHTPLHSLCACQAEDGNGQLAALRLLLEHGADATGGGGPGTTTPLHSLAHAKFGNPRTQATIIRMLVEEGADVNALNDDGLTPLACIRVVMRSHSLSPRFDIEHLLVRLGGRWEAT